MNLKEVLQFCWVKIKYIKNNAAFFNKAWRNSSKLIRNFARIIAWRAYGSWKTISVDGLHSIVIDLIQSNIL